MGEGGLKAKYQANVAAIRLAQALAAAGRQATPEEQAVLVKYVGWGGIPQVFDPENKAWAKEYLELKELLGGKEGGEGEKPQVEQEGDYQSRRGEQDEYAAARASTVNAHFTAPGVVRAIWSALQKLGFTGGRVVEPAGVG